MTTKERKEMLRLNRRWATGKATATEMLRCMELDRQRRCELRANASATPAGAGE